MDSKKIWKIEAQDRLFSFFNALQKRANLVPITHIDSYVDSGKPATFLKHDVHGMSLSSLLKFAQKEREEGIQGSFFFMFPDHPLTAKHYSFSDQIEVMKSLVQLGHEVGIHIDPFFLVHKFQKPLSYTLQSFLAKLREHGITIHCGNTHGNSKFKGKDNNGYGTSFDFFEEIGRQPDYPVLRNVDSAIAEILRCNRTSLSELSISYWADMPLWSKKKQFVATNFISDNNLKKNSSFDITMHAETLRGYRVTSCQPPGSRNLAHQGKTIPVSPSYAVSDIKVGSYALKFHSHDLNNLFSNVGGLPNLLLVHPEHYC